MRGSFAKNPRYEIIPQFGHPIWYFCKTTLKSLMNQPQSKCLDYFTKNTLFLLKQTRNPLFLGYFTKQNYYLIKWICNILLGYFTKESSFSYEINQLHISWRRAYFEKMTLPLLCYTQTNIHPKSNRRGPFVCSNATPCSS